MKFTLVLSLSAMTAIGVFAEGVHDHGAHESSDQMQAVSQAKAPADSKAQSEDSAKPELAVQTTCPVMGGAIDKKIYADHDGKRVYFCCKACVAEFNKNPAKYLKKLEAMGQAAEVIAPPAKSNLKKTTLAPQTTCPVMGSKINKNLFVDYDGQRIYVCCKPCMEKFNKDPVKYMNKLESNGQMAETL